MIHDLLRDLFEEATFKPAALEIVMKIIDQGILTAQEYSVNIRFYGLKGEREHSIYEIGAIREIFVKKVLVSWERVKRIRNSALRKIREEIWAHYYEEFFVLKPAKPKSK